MHSSYNKMLLVAAILFLAACKKDEEPNVVPEITFNGVDKTTIQQFSGPLTFNIGYKDGDGDLGSNTDGVHNLYIKDRRNNLVYPFRVQNLSPANGEQVSIQGSLNVEFAPVVLTDSVPSQSVVFEIYITDRAGHVSNTVNSPQIHITQ